MGKGKRVNKRKPTSLTFVRHKCENKECEKEIIEKMIRISKDVGTKNIKELVFDKNASDTLRTAGIPEVWLHDFENEEHPTMPFRDYYIVDFDDGSKKIFVLLHEAMPDELPPSKAPDVMYQ